MKWLVLIYLYGIYPLCTFLFAAQASLLHENLSFVGNMKGMRGWFILWAVLCEAALAIGFMRCLKKTVYKKYLSRLTILNALIFMASILIPYLPESFPIWSNLHIDLSFISVYLLLILIVILTICLRMSGSVFPYEYVLILIYGAAFFIFSQNAMSVNSLTEIFLAITLPLYLYHLGGKVE